jgi:hypothetical protein
LHGYDVFDVSRSPIITKPPRYAPCPLIWNRIDVDEIFSALPFLAAELDSLAAQHVEQADRSRRIKHLID